MNTSHPLYRKLIEIHTKASQVKKPVDMISSNDLNLWKEMILKESTDFQKKLTTQLIAIRNVKQRLDEVIEDTGLHKNVSRTLATFLTLIIQLETGSHDINTDGTTQKVYDSIEKDTKILWQLLKPYRLKWEDDFSEIYKIFKEGYDAITKHQTYYISYKFDSNFPLHQKYKDIIDEICEKLLKNKLYSLNFENHSFAKIILQYLQENGLWGYCSGTTRDILVSSKKAHYLVQLIDEHSIKNPFSLIKEYEHFTPQDTTIRKKTPAFLELDVVVQPINHKWNQNIRNYNPGRGSAIKSVRYFIKLIEEIKGNIEADRRKFLNKLNEHYLRTSDVEMGNKTDKLRIVSVYAEEDKIDYYDKFMLQCHLLKEKADFWDESMVVSGNSKIIEVEKAVEKADIVLLFISSNLANNFPENTFWRALRIIKNTPNKHSIIPISLKPWAMWDTIYLTNTLTLGNLKSLPNPPITFDDTNKDGLFAEIAKELNDIIENYQNKESFP